MQSDNKYDILQNVFLEESFPSPDSEGGNLLNESFDEEEFSCPEQVKENLKDFWNMPGSKQKKYAKSFPLILEKIGIENIRLLVEGVYTAGAKLLEDNYDVSSLLLNDIEMLLRCLVSSPVTTNNSELQSQVHTRLLAFIKSLVESKNPQLQYKSRHFLVKIAEYLDDQNYNNELLTIVLTLLHDNINQSNRLAALSLITQLHTRFSKSYIEGFIATDIIALMQDPKVSVRVEACKTFFVILTSFENDFIERKFFDLIEGMSDDNNNDIRIIFVQNMPLVSQKLSFKKFEYKILPKFINTLSSKNRFVKEEAYHILGQLIVALLQSKNATNLLEVFHSATFDKIYEKYFELPKLIAKMNPNTKKNIIKANYGLLRKVIVIKKPNLWDKIKKLFVFTEELDKAIIEIAKLELAQQLDHIATVLDHQIVEKELIQLIDKKYLTIGPTTSEKVKQTTIKVLAGVLKQLNKETREKYADVYQLTMGEDIRKWRFRFVISEQIHALSSLFNSNTITYKIVPMIFAFCKDNCSIVRKTASNNIWRLLSNVREDSLCKRIVLMNIKEFGKYNRFSLRQSFIFMIEGIALNLRDEIDQEMIDILKELAEDPVVNNRICLAMFLGSCKLSGFSTDWTAEILRKLLEEPDIDLFKHLRKYYYDSEVATVLDEHLDRLQKKRRATVAKEKEHVDEIRKQRSSESKPKDSQTSDKDAPKNVLDGLDLAEEGDNDATELNENIFETTAPGSGSLLTDKVSRIKPSPQGEQIKDFPHEIRDEIANLDKHQVERTGRLVDHPTIQDAPFDAIYAKWLETELRNNLSEL